MPPEEKVFVLPDGPKGARRQIGNIFLGLSIALCIPTLILSFFVLPWPIQDATMAEINRKLPLLWAFWSLGMLVLIFSVPAFFLVRRPSWMFWVAGLCLLFGLLVSTLAVPWPSSRLMGSEEVIRKQVKDAQAQMRKLAVALEQYRADHEVYPAWSLDPIVQAPFGSIETLPSFGIASWPGPHTLTTPIAYLQSLPDDPFAMRHEHGSMPGTFGYWVSENGEWWILISPGPNSTFQIDMIVLTGIFQSDERDPRLNLAPFTYDPTNGLISDGDIWLVGPERR